MSIAHSLHATLMQLREVLSGLPNTEFRKPLPILSNASVGQHTRHIIEFFQTLLASYQTGLVNYDKRQRNLLLETNLDTALQELSNLCIDLVADDKQMLLTGTYSDDGQTVTVATTYHRELVYNLEHAIHHMAMIKIGILQSTNLTVPPDFGVAAATILHRKSIA